MGNAKTAIAAILILAGGVFAARDLFAAKDKEPKTQQLREAQDPPMVASGAAARLTFQVSPLSGKGLLSEQTRDAINAIRKMNGNAQLVHIRAFAASNGDARRIPQIIADVLGDKQPLPSVSVLQVGDLPMTDAQVVLEAVSAGKKDVNPAGVTFYPLELVTAADTKEAQRDEQKDLLQKAVDQLAAKMTGKPLAVTCFVSSLDNGSQTADVFPAIVRAKFPSAAIDVVQPRRLAWDSSAGCEGAAAGGSAGSAQIAFTGTQASFGAEPKDAELAVQRLDRAMEQAGVSRAKASIVRVYLLSPSTEAAAKKALGAATAYSVEGVAASSAAFAIDAIAPVR